VRTVLLSLFLLLSYCVQATDTLLVSLYNSQRIKNLIVKPTTGTYEVKIGGQWEPLPNGSPLYFIAKAGGFSLTDELENFGLQTEVLLRPTSPNARLLLAPIEPKKGERLYANSFTLRWKNNAIEILNAIPLDTYVASVVESEAGGKENVEYYKVQAVICRTFALSNLSKHKKEGFNLCDEVHCQVNKGVARFNADIYIAENATKDLVLVDRDLNLIETVFHSNCGGATINSEDYWKTSVPYLRAVADTFCYNEPHATWERSIPKDEWLGYLQRSFSYRSHDSLYILQAINYNPEFKSKWFLLPSLNIPVRRIREDWKFRSGYFSITEKGNKLVFKGRGFGHGVGLCQEGAMVRSKSGFTFSKILHYYYKDVFIVDKSLLSFYKNF